MFKPTRRPHVVRRELERLHERILYHSVNGGRYECRVCRARLDWLAMFHRIQGKN